MTPAEAWLLTADHVLRGLNHAFANRLATVGALASVLDPGEAVDEEIRTTVIEEIGKLEYLLRLYRLMPYQEYQMPEPLRIPDIVPDAVALYRHHLDLRDRPLRVEGSGDPQPVLMSMLALTQAILLVLCAASRRSGLAQDELVLRYAGTEEWVEVSADGVAGADAASPDVLPEAMALRRLVDPVGGTVAFDQVPDGRQRVVMRLLTLREARRRQRAMPSPVA